MLSVQPLLLLRWPCLPPACSSSLPWGSRSERKLQSVYPRGRVCKKKREMSVPGSALAPIPGAITQSKGKNRNGFEPEGQGLLFPVGLRVSTPPSFSPLFSTFFLFVSSSTHVEKHVKCYVFCNEGRQTPVLHGFTQKISFLCEVRTGSWTETGSRMQRTGLQGVTQGPRMMTSPPSTSPGCQDYLGDQCPGSRGRKREWFEGPDPEVVPSTHAHVALATTASWPCSSQGRLGNVVSVCFQEE